MELLIIRADMRLQELGGRVDSHKGSDKTTKRLWQHVELLKKIK